MHILGLCGSLRRNSYNRRLLAAAARELPDGAMLRVFEHTAGIPPYDEDTDARETPAAVQALRSAIAAANGVVIATPEYNGSVPGWLKNAIDWASRPYPNHVFRGKPVIVVGASTTPFGAALAQAELRRVLKAIGALVLEGDLCVPLAHEAFGADGQLADSLLRSQLVSAVHTLVVAASGEGAAQCGCAMTA